MSQPTQDVEKAVRERYEEAARVREAALCCPVDYDDRWLAAIPREIIDRDYGCGDPSRYLRQGETVLDLGSGGGKICYIASQVVGAEGRVIGVDVNDEMLALAESHHAEIARKIGYDNVVFKRGKIQELQPLIADGTIDVIVSNCVLNLVAASDKLQLFKEMYRVLRDSGRAVISDIVSDKDVPLELQNDPELWSGCISGAFREDRFVAAFEEAGFREVRVLKRDDAPWQMVDGIEFRSVTIEAARSKGSACCSPSDSCC